MLKGEGKKLEEEELVEMVTTKRKVGAAEVAESGYA